MIHFKRIHYNNNIYEYNQLLKVIKYDMVRNSSGRLSRYFGAATVTAACACIVRQTAHRVSSAQICDSDE